MCTAPSTELLEVVVSKAPKTFKEKTATVAKIQERETAEQWMKNAAV